MLLGYSPLTLQKYNRYLHEVIFCKVAVFTMRAATRHTLDIKKSQIYPNTVQKAKTEIQKR